MLEYIYFIKEFYLTLLMLNTRMLHEEHSPDQIIYGHRIYQFDRGSGSDMRTLLIS